MCRHIPRVIFAALVLLSAMTARADEKVSGRVVLSNGNAVQGRLFLTPGKLLRFFDPENMRAYEFPLADVSAISARVRNRMEHEEFRWRESASAEKVKSGRTRITLEMDYLVTLKGRGKLLLRAKAGMPLYVEESADKTTRVLIQPSVVGEYGQAEEDLAYPTEIIIGRMPAR